VNGNGAGTQLVRAQAATLSDRRVLDEVSFHRMIAVERKRTERSRKPFLLMLVDTGDSLPSSRSEMVLTKMLGTLALETRETDVPGWYKATSVVGVMFTEMAADGKNATITAMVSRVNEILRSNLSVEQISQISISFHVYPENWEHELSRRPSNPALYPDLTKRDEARNAVKILKRVMDVVGSIMAIILFAPLILAVAAAIKLTSPGPILFRQERIGEHGRPFVFLKFRSMHVNNDAVVHQQWFKRFVSGQAELQPTSSNSSGTFKMVNDPRVTRVGRILRRTSLDELPQFINVLKGEMSLVGPRPPIPYEVEAYQTWHRGRILQAKPGITGLWQVAGRSRVPFDEMVRLDLRYARTWSLGLDMKILLQTPRAVLLGDGAY
jgi:exopolysaccharide biosynthesis polyprenyl glycosylphosphotransferase